MSTCVLWFISVIYRLTLSHFVSSVQRGCLLPMLPNILCKAPCARLVVGLVSWWVQAMLLPVRVPGMPKTHEAFLHTDALVPGRCRFAITGSEDSTARVWDLQAPPRVDDQNHAGKVHCMSVAPDGATAVSVAADGCAMVWDVQSGNCCHTLKGHATALHWASLASDGRTLLTVAGDRMIKVWDIVSGTCGATLPSKHCISTALWTCECVAADHCSKRAPLHDALQMVLSLDSACCTWIMLFSGCGFASPCRTLLQGFLWRSS